MLLVFKWWCCWGHHSQVSKKPIITAVVRVLPKMACSSSHDDTDFRFFQINLGSFSLLSLSKLTYTDLSSLLKSLMFCTHKRFPAESKSKHAHVVKYIGYIGAFRKPILFLPDGRRDKAFQSTPVSNWRWHFSHLSTTPASATKMMVVLVPKISFSKEALLLFLKWKDFQKVSLDEFVCLDDKLT